MRLHQIEGDLMQNGLLLLWSEHGEPLHAFLQTMQLLGHLVDHPF